MFTSEWCLLKGLSRGIHLVEEMNFANVCVLRLSILFIAVRVQVENYFGYHDQRI